MTLLAGHIARHPNPRHVDRYARRELTEHIAALCAAVHGTRYGQRCQQCVAALAPGWIDEPPMVSASSSRAFAPPGHGCPCGCENAPDAP